MRFLIVIFVLLSLLFGGVLIAPQFVDWNKYKPQIISQVKTASGYDIELNGKISAAIFPSAKLTINNAKIIAPQKNKFDTLISIEKAHIQVALAPLLEKKLVIKEISLITPVIQAEILSNGTPSWDVKKAQKTTPNNSDKTNNENTTQKADQKKLTDNTDIQSAMNNIAIDQVKIKNGRVVYVDHVKNATQTIEEINITLNAKSLNGPFASKGSLIANGNNTQYSVETGLLPQANEPLPLKWDISLAEKNIHTTFDGVTSLQLPYETQGKFTFKSDENLPIMVDGIISATAYDAALTDMTLSLDKQSIKGKLSVANIAGADTKKPLLISASLQSDEVIDITSLLPTKKKRQSSEKIISDIANDNSQNNTGNDKITETVSASLIPQILTLPMDIELDAGLNIAGIQYQKTQFKNIAFDLSKKNSTIKTNVKINNIPGGGQINSDAILKYASSSKSSKSNETVYSDPTLDYSINGQVNDVAYLLSTLDVEVDGSSPLSKFKTAQISLTGGVNGDTVTLKDSALKIDDMSIGLDAQYTPKNMTGKSVDIAAITARLGTVNLDHWLNQEKTESRSATTNNNKQTAAISAPKSANSTSKDKAALSIPLDVSFDIGVQKLINQGQHINGIRIKGSARDNVVNLSSLSINDFNDMILKASSKITIDGSKYILDDLSVGVNKTTLNGNLSVDTKQSIPQIRGSLNGKVIDLESLTQVNKSQSTTSTEGSTPAKKTASTSSSKSTDARWSKDTIDLGWMHNIDTKIGLKADAITHGAWTLEKPETILTINKGRLNIDQMNIGLFGGQADMDATLTASPLTLTMNSTMNNIDLEKLAAALSGGNKLKSTGTVSFATQIKTTGSSAHALINALSGTASLNGTDIALEGFDLAAMARGLAVEEKLATSVSSLISGATNGGETRFDTLKGEYNIDKGTVKIETMALTGEAATINSTGYVDLPQWFINVDNVIALNNVSDLDPFTVKIKGSLDNPSNTFGKNILEDYLTQKLKRKLLKQAPDLLGDSLTGKLEKFGILPQKESSSDTPPSNDNPAPSKETPTNPINQILEDPSNAEDALKGVLKGLF